MKKSFSNKVKFILIIFLLLNLKCKVILSQNLHSDTVNFFTNKSKSKAGRSLVLISDSGAFRAVNSLENEKWSGIQIQYLPNGKVGSISQYSGLCQTGEAFEFHDNGNIKSYFNFNDVKIDTCKKKVYCYCVKSGGIEKYDSTYFPLYSVMNGIKYYFSNSGTLEYGEEYQNNSPTGLIYYFDTIGNVINTIYKKPECDCEIIKFD